MRRAPALHGGNVVSRVRVTLEQQPGNGDSGNEIKGGGSFGIVFISRSRPSFIKAKVPNQEADKRTLSSKTTSGRLP